MSSWRCPEALRHGPLDGTGRCPWCHQQVERSVPLRERVPRWEPTELTEAYAEFYDPDGLLDRRELERRRRAGTADL